MIVSFMSWEIIFCSHPILFCQNCVRKFFNGFKWHLSTKAQKQKRKEGHLKIANDGGKIATVNEHTNWIVSRGEVRGDLGMHMPLASQNP